MTSPFSQAERRYRELHQAYEQGQLDSEQFAQELSSLQIQDEKEQWWQIQGNGQWLRFNAQSDAWEPASPPKAAPPPPPRVLLAPPPRQPAEPSGEPDDEILQPDPAEPLLQRASLLELLQPPPAAPNCSACGAALAAEARFCSQCGQPISS